MKEYSVNIIKKREKENKTDWLGLVISNRYLVPMSTAITTITCINNCTSLLIATLKYRTKFFIDKNTIKIFKMLITSRMKYV